MSEDSDPGLDNFDATVSGETANAYLERDEIDSEIEAYDGADAWSELTQEAKDRLQLKAARLVDRFRKDAGGWGPKLIEAQRLAFPRSVDKDLDGDGVIPEGVKIAVLEYVSSQLVSNLDEIKRPQAEGVTSQAILGTSQNLTADDSLLPAECRGELEALARANCAPQVNNAPHDGNPESFFFDDP